MNFRTAKANLLSILDANPVSYVVIGFRHQGKSAEEVLNYGRTVQVFYASGDFVKDVGRMRGNVQHDVTFKIELTVAKDCEGDLSIINDPDSYPDQVSLAINMFQEATDLADTSMDELIELVYQKLMNATQYDVGLTKGIVSNRWVSNVTKNSPVPRGESVILTASMLYTCRMSEEIVGAVGTIGDLVYDVQVDVDDDDIERAGVTGDLGG